jgi:hypothetical protein
LIGRGFFYAIPTTVGIIGKGAQGDPRLCDVCFALGGIVKAISMREAKEAASVGPTGSSVAAGWELNQLHSRNSQPEDSA